MQPKSLIALLFAAAFALPLAANAGGGAKHSSEKSASAAQSAAADGGAEAMFASMDKNKDGFISKDEAKGTPHFDKFAELDKNADGKLSREEHAAAPEHAKVASGTSTPSEPVGKTMASESTGKKTY